MKILVTGGLGFLGSHLAERLLAEGHAVTLVDNCSTNVVAPEFFRDRARVLVGAVRAFVPDEVYAQIYHCASIVGPAGVLPYGGQLGADMAQDAFYMAQLALAQHARLLFVSTSEVYGHAGILDEETPKVVAVPASPRLEYALGKLLGETMVLNAHRRLGLEVNVVRPFNIVGPRQSSQGGFVLPRFIQAARRGEDLTVFGDGQQLRAFSHVADVVDAMVTIMNSTENGQVYNVGNPANTLRVEQLAQKVIALLPGASRIVYVDPQTIYGPLYAEAFDKIPDITKLRTRLGWEPRWDLDRTLRDTIDYFYKT